MQSKSRETENENKILFYPGWLFEEKISSFLALIIASQTVGEIVSPGISRYACITRFHYFLPREK